MARVEIRTPEPGHNGPLGKIAFGNGVAIVDEDEFPNEVAYCRARGYVVTDYVEPKPPAAEEPRQEEDADQGEAGDEKSPPPAAAAPVAKKAAAAAAKETTP